MSSLKKNSSIFKKNTQKMDTTYKNLFHKTQLFWNTELKIFFRKNFFSSASKHVINKIKFRTFYNIYLFWSSCPKLFLQIAVFPKLLKSLKNTYEGVHYWVEFTFYAGWRFKTGNFTKNYRAVLEDEVFLSKYLVACSRWLFSVLRL